MSKKKSSIILTLFIIMAVFIGIVLVNKGDGPVSGIILSNFKIEDEQMYKKAKNKPGSNVFNVTEMKINKYKKKIPKSCGLFANIRLVECRKGTKIKLKWIYENEMLKQEEKSLTTDQKGILSYELEANKVKPGNYTIEIYYENKKAFIQKFNVE